MVLLIGCQATGKITGQVWSPVIGQDEFTDKVTKMVTVGDLLSDKFVYTRSLRYYPFVGVRDGEIYVGIRSGGPYRVPVGTVQIRVDGNKSWTISTEETPVHLAPDIPASSVPVALNGDVENLIQKTHNQAMSNAAKMMSPYTATTGDKAKSIIREMVRGKIVKYRTVGFNQAASTTGEVKIDNSFLSSLRAIGITPENL